MDFNGILHISVVADSLVEPKLLQQCGYCYTWENAII